MASDVACAPAGGIAAGRESWSVPAVALVAAVAALAHLCAPLTGDVSWLLTVGDRILSGQRLYADIYELNPPMSAWLYLPFAWASANFGVASETLLVFGVVGLALISLAVSETILAPRRLVPSRMAWRLVVAFALLIAPVTTFAQREHFAIMMILPLIACVAARLSGRAPEAGQSVVAGLLGGLALSIKPHFALAVLLPAAFAAVRRRSLKPIVSIETVVAGALVIAYLATITVVYPLYFSQMLPLAGAVYLPNRLPLWLMALLPQFIVVCLIMAALWRMRPDFAKSPLGVALGLGTLGFAIAFLIQGHGWPYQLLPALTLATVAFGLSLFDPPLFREKAGFARTVSAAVAALLIVGPAMDYAHWRGQIEPTASVLRPFGPGLRIALLSGELNLGSPLHRALGATFVNRGPMLWLADNAMAVCGRDGVDEGQLRACRDAIALDRAMFREDVIRQPPDAIVAEAGRTDWIAWARKDPALAVILDGYREIASVEQAGATAKILVRNDLKAGS